MAVGVWSPMENREMLARQSVAAWSRAMLCGERSPAQYDQMVVDRFPEIEGTSLSLVEHHLPGSLAGRLNLLLIAFRQWQQGDVDTWMPVATSLAAEHAHFRFYELPVISRAYRPVSGFIDGGMRSGIPDPDVRASTITVYVNRRWFLDSLGIESVGEIVPMLVTASGEILWRTTGRMTIEASRELRAAVEDAL